MNLEHERSDSLEGIGEADETAVRAKVKSREACIVVEFDLWELLKRRVSNVLWLKVVMEIRGLIFFGERNSS